MKPKEFFESLKPGDLLTFPCINGAHSHCTVVLSTGTDKDGYFVRISQDDQDMHLPMTFNPLRWDDKLERAVDREGDTEEWLLPTAKIERGVRLDCVEEYNALPRPEDLPSRVTREECNAFIDSPEGATLLKRIRSIHQNPEIDTKSDAVCLALQAIGIEPTARIVAGIAAFTTRMPHGVALMAMVGRTDETSSPEDPHSVN